MKIRKILTLVFAAIIAVNFYSCKKCKGEKPRARIVNNGTAKSTVQVKTSGGNTSNINNVDPGQTSDYASYDAGNVEFTITVGNKSTVVYNAEMKECFEYDIEIDANN